jgi:geranylgeranyl diphosphate synthase type I
VHDDVMDRAETRRGEPTIHVRMAEGRPGPEGERFGVSAAILAGDLVAVLGDHLFLHAGFPPDVLMAAFSRYNRMRVEVAVGQFLDLSGSARMVDEEEARQTSRLKSGSYTVEGPLQIGAILAGAPAGLLDALTRYGRPLGEAFQLRNDLDDAAHDRLDLVQSKPTVLLAKARELASNAGRDAFEEAVDAVEKLAGELVEEAVAALTDAGIPPEVEGALTALARAIG